MCKGRGAICAPRTNKRNPDNIHPMKYIALALSAVLFGLVSCKSSSPTPPPATHGYVHPAK